MCIDISPKDIMIVIKYEPIITYIFCFLIVSRLSHLNELKILKSRKICGFHHVQ